MNVQSLVRELANVSLPNVFNPYRDVCPIFDRRDAPAVRRRNLRAMLESLVAEGVETVWMGRDLGYRGGRRTGLALTDERHLGLLNRVYPGAKAERSTIGPEVAERTAAEIWGALTLIRRPPLLWNVFPFHPHESQDSQTNRKFTSKELAYVDELNATLFTGLGIRQVISIGQDASKYGQRFGLEVTCVRHPSYGGTTEFRRGIADIYGIDLSKKSDAQTSLF
jgi:hypothetical protein